MPDISEKRYNRLELKEKLLKNIWNEELMMEKKDYTVAYTEDAISMMDETYDPEKRCGACIIRLQRKSGSDL